MAPTDSSNVTPKVHKVQNSSSVTKTIAARNRSSPASVLKKTISSAKKRIQKIPIQMNNKLVETRQRTSTVPKVNTPKPKENKVASLPPSSVTKSAKKQRKQYLKPAHSGVPVPEKMKALMQGKFKDLDDSL